MEDFLIRWAGPVFYMRWARQSLAGGLWLVLRFLDSEAFTISASWLRSFLHFIFLFFGHTTWRVGILVSHQGSSQHALHWKHAVLTTGPPGKSWLTFVTWPGPLGQPTCYGSRYTSWVYQCGLCTLWASVPWEGVTTLSSLRCPCCELYTYVSPFRAIL